MAAEPNDLELARPERLRSGEHLRRYALAADQSDRVGRRPLRAAMFFAAVAGLVSIGVAGPATFVIDLTAVVVGSVLPDVGSLTMAATFVLGCGVAWLVRGAPVATPMQRRLAEPRGQ